MNKTAIKNFAIWARNKLIADIQYRAGLMGITAQGIKNALPQSTYNMEFYDIGTAEPYSITGEAIRQREKLVEILRQKEADSDYPTAYKYILEEVAYTWFNRLIAIRFMEVNDYLPSHIRVLSSETGKVEPDLVTTPFDAELDFTPAEEETILRLKNAQYEYTVYYECDDEGVPFVFPTKNQRWKTARKENFAKIPGSPLSYWVSSEICDVYSNSLVKKYMECKSGIMTGDDSYIRLWTEIATTNLKLDCRSADDMGEYRWFPLNSGGDFRYYYGNNSKVVNLWHDGFDIKANVKNYRLRDKSYYFKKGITWGRITSSKIAFREVVDGSLFGDAGPIGFIEQHREYLLGFLCSKVALYFLEATNPTLNYQVRDIENLPLLINEKEYTTVTQHVTNSISVSKSDWDSFETSWDFQQHPLVRPTSTVADAFVQWETECNDRFKQLEVNENELNRIFIGIYGLQDELTPEVEDKDVTVRKADLQRDIKSLLSYAVGCMFGRYSLDVDGLAYAGGDWDESKYKTFLPDMDGIIPITDEEYLGDDIVTRLCSWLKVVYGEDTLEENLAFIAKALGNRGNSSQEIIRNYFLKDFFKDHSQTYSVTGFGRRPIYWLFDSGKQNGFKALIYIHRYTPDTIGNLRVDYLHKMQRVYESEIGRMQDMIDHSTNAREVAAATKRKEKLQKQLKECRDYDEMIAHLALSRIELDLDDGVKVNYRKIQTAADGKFYEVLADSKNIMAKG